MRKPLKMQPTVSIIIPAYNAQDTIGQCLDSIMNLDYPKELLQAIVIDNNSQDSTRDIIRKYPVEYEFENKRYLGAVRNKGILKAKGEFIAFVDADCMADKFWLQNLIKGFDNSNIAACAGEVKSYQPEKFIAKYMDQRGVYSQEKALRGKGGFMPFLMTCNVILPKRILEEVNYFDENLSFFEDTDLFWRIALRGYSLKIMPEAAVYHIHKANLVYFFRKFFFRGSALYFFFRKYKKKVKLHLIIYTEIQRIIHDWINNFRDFLSGIGSRNKNSQILFIILDIIKNGALILGFVGGLILSFRKAHSLYSQNYLLNYRYRK